MDKLNFPEYDFKYLTENDQHYIWDIVRKKYVALTPEEWVRQHMIHYLVKEKGAPSSLIRVESGLRVNELYRRADIIVYSNSGRPMVIVECKACSVKLSQGTFDQAARYNISLRVPLLIITNGINHFCCKVDFGEKTYTFLGEIPGYKEILSL